MGLLDRFMGGGGSSGATGGPNPLMARFMNPMTQYGLALLTGHSPAAAMQVSNNWMQDNMPRQMSPLQQMQLRNLESQIGARDRESGLAAAASARTQSFLDSLPPEQRAAAAVNPSAFAKPKSAPGPKIQQYNLYANQARAAGQPVQDFITWDRGNRAAGASRTTINTGQRSALAKLIADRDDAATAGDVTSVKALQDQIDKTSETTKERLDITQEASLDPARNVYKTLDDQLFGDTGIFKDVEDTIKGRAKFIAQSNYQQLAQTDPRFKAYDDYVKGTIAPLVRGLGEKGALANEDVDRALGLVPSITGFSDSKAVAQSKMELLARILKTARDNEEEGIVDAPSIFDKEAKKLGLAAEELGNSVAESAMSSWEELIQGLEEVPD